MKAILTATMITLASIVNPSKGRHNAEPTQAKEECIDEGVFHKLLTGKRTNLQISMDNTIERLERLTIELNNRA